MFFFTSAAGALSAFPDNRSISVWTAEKFEASARRTIAASTSARPLPLDLTLRRSSSSSVIMYT